MTACPCCFQPLSDMSFRWQCETPTCQEADPVAQSWLGESTRTGKGIDWRKTPGQKVAVPGQVGCPTCGHAASPACPVCHFLLPPDWRGSTTVTMALAGARNTGKSVYIGVVVRFLADVASRIGGSLTFGHPRSHQVYRDTYETALFKATGAVGGSVVPGRIIGPTPRSLTGNAYQRFPLIISLGRLAQHPVHLIIRDVAGEDLEGFAGGYPQDANLQFFRHADQVMYLFDPLTVPFVAGALEGLIPRQMQEGVANPVDVLMIVLRLIHPGKPNLVIAMSKFDAFSQFRRVSSTALGRVMASPGSAMVRNPPLTGSFDREDSLLVHEEVRGLLQEVGADQLIKLAEPFTHRFMGISSLGDSPDGQSLSKYGISPHRVLDPILWALASKNLIKVT